jgi:voltage-dependent potassium channel beta subunit
MDMTYRRLGSAGLKVSTLSYGSWVSFGNQLDVQRAKECMDLAYRSGVNFFDNAEAYASGESETIMGQVIRDLGWPRHSYAVSTKLFWGLEDTVNMKKTLNRKYLLHAIDGSLERFGLDFVDLVFCHRADPETPIGETVQAMHDIVASGKALYWGTSEWTADEIRAAWDYADRHHLHRPQMGQPEYHLLHRDKVEREFARLYADIGLGLTTWSPLASGLLTGKYADGVPDDSRAQQVDFLRERLTDAEANRRVRALKEVADDLDCSLAQLAIAWCARNPNVSTVILGASKPEQLEENLSALDVVERIDDEVCQRMDKALEV